MPPRGTAIIVGVGPGLGRALAQRFSKAGFNVAMLARNTTYLDSLKPELSADVESASVFCDVTNEESVAAAFKTVDEKWPGAPYEVMVYNVAMFGQTPFLQATAADFERNWKTLCLGGALTAQHALRKMVQQGHGTLLFTGATAGLRGSAKFAPFAVGKFGLRALAQSLAREFHPQGVHVAHIIVDGIIDADKAKQFMGPAAEGVRLKPEAIADVYYDVYKQHKSAWTHELDLRPAVESF